LYQITAASRTPEWGLPPPDPRSLCPLSSTEFVEPPHEQNSWVRHWAPQHNSTFWATEKSLHLPGINPRNPGYPAHILGITFTKQTRLGIIPVNKFHSISLLTAEFVFIFFVTTYVRWRVHYTGPSVHWMF